jgi:hypothetical protein
MISKVFATHLQRASAALGRYGDQIGALALTTVVVCHHPDILYDL